MKTIHFLLTASLVLAFTLTLACSSDSGNSTSATLLIDIEGCEKNMQAQIRDSSSSSFASTFDVIKVICILLGIPIIIWRIWKILRILKVIKSEEDRVKYFIGISNFLTKNSIELEEILHKWYKEDLGDGITGTHILYKPDWIHKSGAELIKLKDVKVNYSGKYYDKNEMGKYMKNIFPERKLSFFTNALKYLNKNYWSRPTFSWKAFSMDCAKKEAILDVYLGEYYDFLNTCMPFQYETVYEFLFKNLKKPSDNSLRKEISLLDSEKRFVEIGISVLTVVKNIGKERSCMFLLHNRSDKVTTSGNQIHVVPSGGYQPTIINADDADEKINKALKNGSENLMATVEREFAEEIFGIEEADDLNDNAVLKDILKENDLRDMLGNTYLLGTGFYPLDTHFDVLAISIIDAHILNLGDSAEEIEKNVKGNFEGQIKLKPFTEHFLKDYSKKKKATPGLKAIFEIVLGDFKNISEQLGI